MAGSWLFAVLAVGQVVMGVAYSLVCARIDLDGSWYLAWAMVLLLFLVVDVGLVLAFEWCERKERADEANRRLQAELDACLQACERQMPALVEVAHLRHDLRNDLATIASLAQSGETERAACMLAALEERVRKAGGQ